MKNGFRAAARERTEHEESLVSGVAEVHVERAICAGLVAGKTRRNSVTTAQNAMRARGVMGRRLRESHLSVARHDHLLAVVRHDRHVLARGEPSHSRDRVNLLAHPPLSY